MGKQRVASEISEMSLNATWWGFAGDWGGGGCGNETGLLFFRRFAGRAAGFLLLLSDSDDDESEVSSSESDSYSDSDSGCAVWKFWEEPLPRGRSFARLEDAVLGVVVEILVVVFGEFFTGRANCELTADLNGLCWAGIFSNTCGEKLISSRLLANSRTTLTSVSYPFSIPFHPRRNERLLEWDRHATSFPGPCISCTKIIVYVIGFLTRNIESKSSLPLRSKTLEGFLGTRFRYEHSGWTAGCSLCHSSRRFSTLSGIVFLGPNKCSAFIDDVDEFWFSLLVLVVYSLSTEPSEESSSLSSSSASCRLYISDTLVRDSINLTKSWILHMEFWIFVFFRFHTFWRHRDVLAQNTFWKMELAGPGIFSGYFIFWDLYSSSNRGKGFQTNSKTTTYRCSQALHARKRGKKREIKSKTGMNPFGR